MKKLVNITPIVAYAELLEKGGQYKYFYTMQFSSEADVENKDDNK